MSLIFYAGTHSFKKKYAKDMRKLKNASVTATCDIKLKNEKESSFL